MNNDIDYCKKRQVEADAEQQRYLCLQRQNNNNDPQYKNPFASMNKFPSFNGMNTSKGRGLNDIYGLIDQYGSNKFSYDPATDEMYQKYLDLARQNGELAMKDTMAKASSMTGGYSNSYAQLAGQGVYNQHLSEAEANMDDYYALALDAYKMEQDQLLNQIGLMQGMEQTEYDRAWNEDERDYNRSWNEDERDYSRGQDSIENAILGAQYGDYSGLVGAGIISKEKADAIAKDEEQARELEAAALKSEASGDVSYLLKALGFEESVINSIKESQAAAAEEENKIPLGDTEKLQLINSVKNGTWKEVMDGLIDEGYDTKQALNIINRAISDGTLNGFSTNTTGVENDYGFEIIAPPSEIKVLTSKAVNDAIRGLTFVKPGNNFQVSRQKSHSNEAFHKSDYGTEGNNWNFELGELLDEETYETIKKPDMNGLFVYQGKAYYRYGNDVYLVGGKDVDDLVNYLQS